MGSEQKSLRQVLDDHGIEIESTGSSIGLQILEETNTDHWITMILHKDEALLLASHLLALAVQLKERG